MKRHLIILSLICYSLCANAEPSTLIDDETQVNPLISLRSLETGVPLPNQQYTDMRNQQWIISEVLPSETSLTKSGLTQFRAIGFPRCLYSIQNRFITANCDPRDNGSLWQLIPSTLGGVQIKSVRTELCLSAGQSYSDYQFAPCQEDENKPVSTKLLWILAPAAMPASLSPALPEE
ncbi:hypothetical protein L4F91_09015 [Avibacterium sp. 20-126]|uniref:hypothetical protein n=1 Tax=Avibacterium sp. 20-126 TaxID=2911524 RepID=UPI00218B06B5|nr:hypothetical protein L4F91_09015 [Avibacterium sp. 20-126]